MSLIFSHNHKVERSIIEFKKIERGLCNLILKFRRLFIFFGGFPHHLRIGS